MITTSEIKRGTTVEVDGSLYQVVDVQHVKTKKSAVYKVKLRDLRAGHIVERSFNAGEKLSAARVERREMQYLYASDDTLTFMNTETYDQIEVAKSLIEEALPYFKEGDALQVITHGEEALGIELPPAVELKITQSDPGDEGRYAERREQAGDAGDRADGERPALYERRRHHQGLHRQRGVHRAHRDRVDCLYRRAPQS